MTLFLPFIMKTSFPFGHKITLLFFFIAKKTFEPVSQTGTPRTVIPRLLRKL